MKTSAPGKSLGYIIVPVDYADEGQVLQIQINTGDIVDAVVTSLPFVDNRAE